MTRAVGCLLVVACGTAPVPPVVLPPVGVQAPVDAQVAAPVPADAARVVRHCAAPMAVPTAAIAGLVPVWQFALGNGTGGIAADVVDDFVIVRFQGGRSVAIDVATGGECAVLAETGRPGIDAYTLRSGISHGALVGGNKHDLIAVELATGAQRWRRQLLDPADHDEYALRDALQVASLPQAIVVAFPLRHRDGDLWRYDEVVIALDPSTGAERWRAVGVAHARGESMQSEGTMVIASDGARILARSPGKLAALDGATGRELWATTWKPPARYVGPPTPASTGPRIAAGHDRVAVAWPDRIRVFDTRAGAQVADVAMAGPATELVVDGDDVFAAIEAAPGNASVVAIKRAAIVWSHPALYAIDRLRVDAANVYVADGTAKITAYARADGTQRFAMRGAGDFVIAPGPRVIVPGSEIVAFDPPAGSVPPALDPYPRWELDAACGPSALAWVDGEERVVWQHPIPARMRGLSFGPCHESEVMYYRRNPRANVHLLYRVFGIVAFDKLLVEADVTGLSVLAATDGAQLLDVPATGSQRALFYDAGKFTFDGGCTGDSKSAQVFAHCGDRIVYFNGSSAFVVRVDPKGPPRIEARATYPTDATIRSQGIRTDVTLRIGGHTLVLKGVTFVE